MFLHCKEVEKSSVPGRSSFLGRTSPTRGDGVFDSSVSKSRVGGAVRLHASTSNESMVLCVCETSEVLRSVHSLFGD